MRIDIEHLINCDYNIINMENKMKNFKILFVLTSIIMTSCAGVKFANAPVNRSLPDAFTKRALYPGAGYEFQDLVGNILLIKKNVDPIRIGLIRPTGYKDTVDLIKDSYNYYKSRIQKGAEAKGSYLAFAADFKADQLSELELVDVARATIAFDNDSVFKQVINQATIWVNQHPKRDTSTTRIWIKSVVLTRKMFNDFTNVGAKASAQVGDVVGVSTGVYHKNEECIKSVITSFEAFDLDELVKQTTVTQTSIPKTLIKANYFSPYTSTIEGKIK